MSYVRKSSQAYHEKETRARKVLELRFGVPLPETEVPVSGGVVYKFDLVSPDRKIVGEIRASGFPARGKLRETQIAEMCEACLFLLGAKEADMRLLVFTEREFYEPFVKTRQARVAASMGVELLQVEA